MRFDPVQVLAAVDEPRVASLIGIRRRFLPVWWPGCLVLDGTTVTLYDRSDQVVLETDVSTLEVRKRRLDGLVLRTGGRSVYLYGRDPGLERRLGRKRATAVLDRHDTLERLPGVREADQRTRRSHQSRQVLWSVFWVAALTRRGATKL